MSSAEDRISRLGPAAAEGRTGVELQLREVERLQQDLENQHAAVSAISNFILIESEEATNIEDQLTGLVSIFYFYAFS